MAKELKIIKFKWFCIAFALLSVQFIRSQEIIRTDDKTIDELIEIAKKPNRLDLSNRNLKEIPDAVYRLSDLEHLDVSRNPITSIEYEQDIGLLNIKKLKSLNISQTKINQIEKIFTFLRNIESLSFSKNVVSFPSNIGHSPLKRITCDFGENSPVNFERINIEELIFDGVYSKTDDFIEFPASILKLKSLKIIRLGEIRQGYMTFDLSILTNLQEFVADETFRVADEVRFTKYIKAIYNLKYLKLRDTADKLLYVNSTEGLSQLPIKNL